MEGLAGGTVYHIASYGMSGLQMVQTRLTYEVNVLGTENVIRGTIHPTLTLFDIDV